MKKRLLLLVLSASAIAGAQVSTPSIVAVTVAPSGACSANLPIKLKTPSGTLYTCQNGTWGVGGGGGTGSFVTLQNVYAAPGSFTFAHGLNSIFYQIHCWTVSGSTYAPATWTDFPVDANDATVTVPSAGTYICSFNSSGAYTPTGDFSVAVSPGSQTFWPTMSGTQTTPAYTVTQTGTGGYTGTASYTASGLASGMSAAYSPTSITGSGTSALTLSFPANQAAATTAFAAQGADGTHTHTANPSITVGNINSGLVECWPMTDGSGTTFVDGCGTGNNATITAGTLTWQTNYTLPGVTPLFSSTAYATGTNHTATNFDGSTPFSVSAWVAVNSVTGVHTVVSTLAPSGSNFTGWEFDLDGNGTALRFHSFFVNSYPSNALEVVSNTYAMSASTLYYVVMTYDGSKALAGVTFYINGVLTATNPIPPTNTLTASIANGLNPLIGARLTGSQPVNGVLSYVRIYNRVLSSADVSNYYAAGAR